MNNNKPPPTFNQQESSSLVTELRQLASHKDVDPLINGIDDAGFGSGTNPPVDDQDEPSTEYTSLQDIIAGETSPPHHTLTCNFSAQQSTSPTAGRNCCWGEVDVAISNPLVKQAAIAYLQPKLTPPDIDHRGWTERFKEYVCGSCGGGGRIGCLGFVGDVFVGMIGWIFGCGVRREETEVMQRRDHQD